MIRISLSSLDWEMRLVSQLFSVLRLPFDADVSESRDFTEEKPLKAINEACAETSPVSPAQFSLIPRPNRLQY